MCRTGHFKPKPENRTSKRKQKMKSNYVSKLIPTMLLASALVSGAVAQDKEPLTAGDAILTSVTATVQAIDLDKREVTLKGPLGNVVTLTVDKRVKRLKEIKVGDDVTADYYVSLGFELRPPTEDEKQHPVQILGAGARAPEGTQPAGGVLRVIKAVTTVQGLDLPTQTVTLKGEGPMGYCATVRAKDVEKLKQLHLGDSIVVTYTEALAVSLEKAKKKKG
jgi:Cu/Ag efflux protein CusF